MKILMPLSLAATIVAASQVASLTAAHAGSTATTTINGVTETHTVGDGESQTIIRRNTGGGVRISQRARRLQMAQESEVTSEQNDAETLAILNNMKEQFADGPFLRYLENYILTH
jgi:hypothetical protein